MKNEMILKQKIDRAEVVSFDIFDTLLFRKTNDPETIFDLVGKHFDIPGFKKLRIDKQNEASRAVYEKHQYPHADMNDIYDTLAATTDVPVDWIQVKEYEIQMEQDALVANQEMLDIFHYAKSAGKRVVATSDMYLLADTLKYILESKGFTGFDHIYCSADEHKAKFDKSLFAHVASCEGVDYHQILHIGDKARDDGEYPASFGMETFVYERSFPFDQVKNTAGSEIDNGLFKILYDEKKSFFYNLGVEAGGPLYTGLCLWLREKIGETDKKIFFLSRDGYNLHRVFQDNGYHNTEYLYTSRRAMILAGITKMDEEAIRELPPYTRGQTVRELLAYLCIDPDELNHLEDAGFKSLDDVITSDEDVYQFQSLYQLDEDVFLKRCEWERKNAIAYLKETGFLDQDSIVFDCGWSGSSQHLLDRLKQAIGCEYSTYFYYFGIKNSEKSHRQLKGKHYEAYAFDYYRNFGLQRNVQHAVVLYELFFSAPHESVYYYGENGVVFEAGNGDQEKTDILQGIQDYLKLSIPFASKYPVEYRPEDAMGHLQRVIENPTDQEAIMLGNLRNVDGFARSSDEEKYIAYITESQYERNPHTEVYWLKGLLKRTDVSESLKQKIAASKGVAYPEITISEYHLEDEQSIRNYHRWIKNYENHAGEEKALEYKPKFSVVMPVYNTVEEQLREAIESVLEQSYGEYELILVDDHSTWDTVALVLKSYEDNSHVKVIYRQTNGHISVATNDGIAIASGEFIVFMDCDDVLAKNALYEFALKLNENPELDFIYSDEDKITEDGKIRHMPFFKPDWSPDLYMCENYTNHLSVYRMSITKAIGGLRSAYNGAQDYDFTLRFLEQSSNAHVGHIQKILYHWRERKESVAYAMNSKNYASEAARRAKESALKRRKIEHHLEYITGMNQYRVVYEVTNEPLVSIIIPSKDHPQILKQCIDSIREYTTYQNYEIIVVDNGSSKENRLKIQEYLKAVKAVYVYDKCEFNFSFMCNQGAKVSRGDYLLFLNDDIEIFQPSWLERILGQAQQEHVGAVGVKLYYPFSTKIQHAGIATVYRNSYWCGPAHLFMYMDDQCPYYFGFNYMDADILAVTGACLLLRRSLFKEIGGFDEALPVAYNDVDLCYKIYEAGYYNVIRNDVVAYHHESLSRGMDALDETKMTRLSGEKNVLFKRHSRFAKCDPFMNSNLHLYGAVLEMQKQDDRLMCMQEQSKMEGQQGSVDAIVVTSETVVITGWSYVPERGDNDILERYLLLCDAYGNLYRCTVENTTRADLPAFFGGKSDALHCGFEAKIDKKKLGADTMRYQMGVLTIAPDEKKYIYWSPKKTTIARDYDHMPVYSPCEEYVGGILHPANKRIEWNLEYINPDESGYRIAGWAFCSGNKHYQYEKQLLLKGSDDTLLVFEVEEQERMDVTAVFPDVHFLFGTGYYCHIWKGWLKTGVEYDLVLRLKHRFDEQDVQDVEVGKKIMK